MLFASSWVICLKSVSVSYGNSGVQHSLFVNFLTFLWSTPSILSLSYTISGFSPFIKYLSFSLSYSKCVFECSDFLIFSGCNLSLYDIPSIFGILNDMLLGFLSTWYVNASLINNFIKKTHSD